MSLVGSNQGVVRLAFLLEALGQNCIGDASIPILFSVYYLYHERYCYIGSLMYIRLKCSSFDSELRRKNLVLLSKEFSTVHSVAEQNYFCTVIPLMAVSLWSPSGAAQIRSILILGLLLSIWMN